MSAPVAYATIMIIWSTTPLGIAWSNESLSPIAAVAVRMSLAAVVGWAILCVFKIKLAWSRAALRTYAFSLMGVYGAMFCVYNAANYIPSGLISVLFALAPLISNLLSIKLLGQGEFTPAKAAAFCIAFSGLAIICFDSNVSEQAWIGIALLLLAVSLYSLSGVLVQKEGYHAHPLSITVGTLITSVPLFAVSWYVMDGTIPEIDWASRSPWAVLYLAIFGSLIGFAAYFYVVRTLGAVSVAMVTLVTPVFALMLGNFLNGEAITWPIALGSVCVLTGLVLYYQNGLTSRTVKPLAEQA